MRIRPFEHRDIAPACRLTNHFIAHTAIHFGTTLLSDADFAATWPSAAPARAPSTPTPAQLTALPASAWQPHFPWLTAELDGTFAGYAKSGTWRARDAYARTSEVTVYVDPAFHRKGIGRALYIELFASLKRAGFHTAIGGITLPNAGSVALHESLGFVHVGTCREVGKKFDRWHDVGFWQLMLT
ncbi:MAG: N-acetyltransferase family protein [Phycisphaerales bacterium]